MRHSEELWIAIVALLAALLLASSEAVTGGVIKLFSNYAYWLIRIVIEATLFIAVLYAIEKIIASNTARFPVYIFAILLSLLPFTLAITSFDLILGLPELGFNDGSNLPHSRVGAFGLELVYLFDNHVILCTLLLLPRLLKTELMQSIDKDMGDVNKTPLFFDTISPPLEGHIYHIEAQEHYVRVVTTRETRMALYRFSDAIRDMPDSLGMQVHRSHWIAYKAVEGLLKDGQNLKLNLSDNETVPVSRSFRTQVEAKFSTKKINSPTT